MRIETDDEGNEQEVTLLQYFPKLKFTTTDVANGGTSNFPCVYIHEMASNETGMDLTNKSVNAVSYNMQIEIYANTSQNDIKIVTKAIVGTIKELGFTFTMIPVFENEKTIYRQVIRINRVIGDGDNDIV